MENAMGNLYFCIDFTDKKEDPDMERITSLKGKLSGNTIAETKTMEGKK